MTMSTRPVKNAFSENRIDSAMQRCPSAMKTPPYQVDRCRVDADDRRCRFSGEVESARRDRCRHEQDEERPDAVVRETLPHLREEQRREAAWLPEEAAIVGDGGESRRHLVVRQRRSLGLVEYGLVSHRVRVPGAEGV
jgi:hypothetical protein